MLLSLLLSGHFRRRFVRKQFVSQLELEQEQVKIILLFVLAHLSSRWRWSYVCVCRLFAKLTVTERKINSRNKNKRCASQKLRWNCVPCISKASEIFVLKFVKLVASLVCTFCLSLNSTATVDGCRRPFRTKWKFQIIFRFVSHSFRVCVGGVSHECYLLIKCTVGAGTSPCVRSNATNASSVTAVSESGGGAESCSTVSCLWLQWNSLESKIAEKKRKWCCDEDGGESTNDDAKQKYYSEKRNAECDGVWRCGWGEKYTVMKMHKLKCATNCVEDVHIGVESTTDCSSDSKWKRTTTSRYGINS